MEFDRTASEPADTLRKDSTPHRGGASSYLARGTAVGRYIVVGLLGAGGMGVVYAAYDPELDRRIALKLVLAEKMDTGAGRVRLLREAQALAKLSHPNVVSVHDVGTHGEQVWIAMEFVAGRTLGAWAAARPRRWPELLAVLTDAARGVAAAHVAGLVHRDLKPDNVMIGDDGRVRVMDFGLAHGRVTLSDDPQTSDAKRGAPAAGELALAVTQVSDLGLRPEVAALAEQLTRAGAIQGTPAYMAPEQWHGQEAQPATDQFGWSVMAWELLYGERPFAGETMPALLTSVLSGQRRPPPSGRGVPGWVRRVLERGLSIAPSGRFPTMAALLSALDRGRVVGRLRNAGAVLAGVAALGVASEGLRRWDIAQRVAACEAQGATIEATWNDGARQRLRDAFMATGVSYAASTADTVAPWLDEKAAAWRQARTDACLNADVEGEWDADLLQRAEWCLEDRQMTIEALVDEYGRADATAVRKAVSATASLRPANECLDELALQVQPMPPAEGREALREVRAALSRAGALAMAGNYKDGLARAAEARARAKVDIEWLPLLAAARALEGDLLERTGSYEAAEKASTEAFFEASHGKAAEVAARAATDLVYIVGDKRARYDDAQMWARHAEVAIASAGDRAGLQKAKLLANLAVVSWRTGAFGEARTQYEQALSIREAALGPDHPDVAGNQNTLAHVHISTGAYAAAQALSERALATREKALGPDHPDVAASLTNLANVHYYAGAHDEARKLFERALAIKEKALGPDHSDVATSLINVAVVRQDAGDYAEALSLCERSLAIRERAFGADHPSVAQSHNYLGEVYRAMGDHEKARFRYERAVAIAEQTLGPQHPDVAQYMAGLAEVHIAAGRPVEALPLIERILAILDTAEGKLEGKPDARFALARALVASGGDRPPAIAAARTARDAFREAGRGKARELAEVERWLAEHDPPR